MARFKSEPPFIQKLLRNPYQEAFLDALRVRRCPTCQNVQAPGKCTSCQTIVEVGHPRGFHRLTLIAGRRGGKTRVGALAAMIEASVPGTRGWVCAPTYPKLHDYVWPAIEAQIPRDWVDEWSELHQELKLKNGSIIQGRSLDDPDRGRGPGLHWLWMDEAAEMQEDAWDIIRPALAEHRGVAWFTTTPKGFDWVYKRLWEVALTHSYNGKKVLGYWACQYHTIDNPVIEQPEVDEARATMSEAMFQQEWEADFVNFRGSIYGPVVSQRILRTVKEIQEIIPEWPHVDKSRRHLVGVDPGAGSEHPFTAACAVLTEKGLVWIGEHRETTQPITYHQAKIKAISHGATNVLYVIDRSRKQDQIELAQHGIFCAQVEAGSGSVRAGIDRVTTWLEQERMFFIKERVPLLIDELQRYRWADSKGADGQVGQLKPFKLKDDLCDCVRYVCMHFPVLPGETQKGKGRNLVTDPLPRGSEKFYWAEKKRFGSEIDRGLRPVEEYPVGEFNL